MLKRLLSVAVAAALIVLAAAPAFAQGGATSSQIAGTVVDTSGGTIPGATIEAKNAATGGVFTSVSTSNGTFTIPAIPSGTYNVTVTLQGFKTAVYNGVTVTAAQPATLAVKLEVGGVSETVTVEAAAAIRALPGYRGVPIVALRTSTHAFNGYPKGSAWESWNFNNNYFRSRNFWFRIRNNYSWNTY